MTIRPLQDRVILKRIELGRTSPGGIVIPDTVAEKPVQGEITAVGNGRRLDNGEVVPMELRPGDRVLFGKYAGTEIKVGDDDLLVMREDDILGVIEN